MKKLQFTKEIKAPVQNVWDVLWNEDSYSEWTKFFNPKGISKVVSDWQVGGKTLFVDGNGNGMVSTIKSKSEPHDIIFEHLGEVSNGKEDLSSEQVKAWSGALEEYHLSANNGITTLKVSVETAEDWEQMLTKGFEKGLEAVKKLAEGEVDG